MNNSSRASVSGWLCMINLLPDRTCSLEQRAVRLCACQHPSGAPVAAARLLEQRLLEHLDRREPRPVVVMQHWLQSTAQRLIAPQITGTGDACVDPGAERVR